MKVRSASVFSLNLLNGDILLDEDSDDEDFNSQDELLLQEEEDYASHNEFEITVPIKTRTNKTLVEEKG